MTRMPCFILGLTLTFYQVQVESYTFSKLVRNPAQPFFAFSSPLAPPSSTSLNLKSSDVTDVMTLIDTFSSHSQPTTKTDEKKIDRIKKAAVRNINELQAKISAEDALKDIGNKSIVAHLLESAHIISKQADPLSELELDSESESESG